MNNNLIEEYEMLKESLDSILPFEVYPTRELVQLLRDKFPITLKSSLSVSSLLNTGDYGGLTCTIEFEKQALVCSLTHLIIPTDNPFYKEICMYQGKRTKKLQKQNKFR